MPIVLRTIRLSILAMLSSVPGVAAAQVVLEPTAPFAERLTDRIPVLGHTLVGVLVTDSARPPTGAGFIAGHMGLPGSLAAVRSPVCVRATSQDGRYYAENNYPTQPSVSAAPRASLGWPSAHPDALAHMKLSEMAVVARSGSCSDKAEVIPVIIGDGAGTTLQVLVNTRGGSITAALRDPETLRTVRRAGCVRADDGAGVAFDARCVLGAVAGLPHSVLLRIEQVSRDGLQNEIVDSATLHLPE